MKNKLFVIWFMVCAIALVTCQKWTQLPSFNQPPVSTEQGGLGIIGNKLYYYGGLRSCDGAGPVCGGLDPCENVFPDRMDVYDLSTSLWSYLVDNTSAVRPSARSTFAYTTYEDLFLIYGGVTYQGGSTSSCGVTFKDGLWAYKTTTGQWTRLDLPSDPNSPGARVHASIKIFNNNLYLFGGLKSPGVLKNDILKFSFSTNTWSVVNAGGSNSTYPAPRYHQVSVIDDDNSRWIIIWGDNFLFPSIRPQINDIWEYSFATNTWRLLDPGTQKALYHPVAGIYKKIVYFAGGDLRPRSFEVEIEEAEINATVTIGGTTYPVDIHSIEIEGEAEPEYYDPITDFESVSTDLHYALDITKDGGIRYVQRIYPTVTPGEFKMAAFDQYKNNKFLLMRGGFRWYCSKFAPRCTKIFLDNVYQFDMRDIDL